MQAGRPRSRSYVARRSRGLWVAALLAALVATEGIAWLESPVVPPGRSFSRPVLPALYEDVSFAGQDGTLSGTLFLPAGGGPHPAVVLLQGSGT